MPILLVAIGVVLFLAGIRGTVGQLGSQLRQDFTGANSFLYWCAICVAIGLLGGIGTQWRTASRALLALVVIAFVLANRGVIANLQSAIASPPIPGPADAVGTPGAMSSPTTGSASGQAGTAATDASTVLPSAPPPLGGAASGLDFGSLLTATDNMQLPSLGGLY